MDALMAQERSALQALGTETYRLNALPKGVTEEVLEALDVLELVECKDHWVGTSKNLHGKTVPYRTPSPLWLSPCRDKGEISSWPTLFKHAREKPEEAAEVRLSMRGRRESRKLGETAAEPPSTLASTVFGFDPSLKRNPELPNLLWFVRAFLAAIDQLTVPDGAGRRLPDYQGALALSVAGDELHDAALWSSLCLQAPFTKRIDDGAEPGIWKFAITAGRGGPDAAFMTAIGRILDHLRFPNARWNEAQRNAAGAIHNRFHAGDVLDTETIERLRSSERIVKARVPEELVPREKPTTEYPFKRTSSVNMFAEPTPPASAGAAASAGARKPLTDEEVESTVRDYIKAARANDVPIDQITRDGIAAATGVAAGRVSKSQPWTALASEKRKARVKERPPTEGSSPAETAIDKLAEAEQAGEIDWNKVRAQQERDQSKPTRNR